MSKVRSHYENLKVAHDAPPEVIRAAYKVLAQKYHPDRNGAHPDAARIMAVVNEAYRVLSDPELKRQHDEWISGCNEQPRHKPKSDSSKEEKSTTDESAKIDLEESYERFRQSWPKFVIAIVIAALAVFALAQ